MRYDQEGDWFFPREVQYEQEGDCFFRFCWNRQNVGCHHFREIFRHTKTCPHSMANGCKFRPSNDDGVCAKWHRSMHIRLKRAGTPCALGARSQTLSIVLFYLPSPPFSSFSLEISSNGLKLVTTLFSFQIHHVCEADYRDPRE